MTLLQRPTTLVTLQAPQTPSERAAQARELFRAEFSPVGMCAQSPLQAQGLSNVMEDV